ncbi:hypothetical protein GUJ93_ZPchr0005g16305 [Zizania palustris]|uniref:Uncharacterized protein n=1 Tax=Zizania palustris TaxID=103762 RepID=A0A8J5T8P7_ZIZPA|nr:hypothetical protein GUJ93_ZPchr0005g16305 [Zizania palustris]
MGRRKPAAHGRKTGTQGEKQQRAREQERGNERAAALQIRRQWQHPWPGGAAVEIRALGLERVVVPQIQLQRRCFRSGGATGPAVQRWSSAPIDGAHLKETFLHMIEKRILCSSSSGRGNQSLSHRLNVNYSDQKKRTLEVLQQRYAATKAKKLQEEQLKCQKRNKGSATKPKFDASRKGKAPESIPCQTSAQLPTKKGPAISNSLLPQDLENMDVVHSVVYDIIQKGGDAGKIMKGAKKLKLEKGILLDNYVHRGPRLVDAQAKSLLIHSKRSKRHMSLKQHKKCGSFDLHETFCKFDLYKPMHEMWKHYIKELIKTTQKKQLSEKLLSADLHGSLVIVAECKSAPYQGVCGIMIRETAETFGIISEDNNFRVVPKAGSVFILQADCWKVTLIGDKLSPREKVKENQRQQRTQAQIR